MVKTKAIKPKEKRTVVSNKKKDRDQFKKEMDMLRLKQKINEIMKKVSNDKNQIENNNQKFKKNIILINEKYSDDSDILYQNMFQKYMKKEFTLICVSFINKIIIDIKRNHLEKYEGKYNLNKLLLSLSKELFLNEFELIMLSLYLEYIDISLHLDIFTMEESLLFISFFVKNLTTINKEIESIKSYLNNKYINFSKNYEKWYNINEKKLNDKLYFSYLEINQRFREYNSPFNIYCGDNYIDYNYIVDRILTMSLPYVDVKKDNNNTIINNINNNSIESSIKNNNHNNDDNDNDNDINNNYINNNYINNNYINNNYINNNKININLEDYKDYNKQVLHPEPFNNIGLKNKNNSNNFKNETSNNSNFNLLNNRNNINNFAKEKNNNKNIINHIPTVVTPNNLLHSLSNINRYVLGPGSNKMLINPNFIGNITNKNNINYPNNEYNDINRPNIVHSNIQIDENFGPKKMNANLMMNNIQTPSQSSFIFQQKPSLMEINLFNRNNSSHMFDDEGETLKQILRGSSDNYFRSSMSFDSPEYPYNAFVNNGNNNNVNNNIADQKCGDSSRRKFNNDIPFRPLNTVCNINTGNNILSHNKIIYNNIGIDYGKTIDNNNENNNIDSNKLKKK